MAQHQTRARGKLDTVDPVWSRIRQEAEEIVRREPELATFIFSTVLHHDTLEAAVVHRVTERLDSADVSAELIRQAYADALEGEPAIGVAFRADIVATVDRDPATDRFIDPVLYLQGLPRHSGSSAGALAVGQGAQGFRLLPAEPIVGSLPDRHPSGGEYRPRHFPRSRHRSGGGRDRDDRGRRVDAAGRDARRHR